MLTNDEAPGIPQKCVPFSGQRLQPITKLCVLRTKDYEMTLFWKPQAKALGLIEVDKREGV